MKINTGTKTGNKKRKYIMWYNVIELNSQGFNKTQIARILGIHRDTVRRYLKMSEEEFTNSLNHKRGFPPVLKQYEDYVSEQLGKYPFLSVPQIHDRLKKTFPDMPPVCEKTVFNFVKGVRQRHNIQKSGSHDLRGYEKLPDTPYGEFAQMDFGESRMHTANGKQVKVYFFAIVLSRTRYKYIYMSRTPFNTANTIYAHELAFQYFRGKPQKILYDQDRVLISDENLGDVLLTRGFRSFVNEQHFQPVFCRKADPESKGKIENVVKFVKYNFLRGRTFSSVEQLNAEALEWLESTGNGKIHGTTQLIPAEEFRLEQPCLIPYYGTPQKPQEEMKEYHVRKDNMVQFRTNYYSVPYGTYRDPSTTVWLQESDKHIELYDKDTGKTICRHEVCMEKGKCIYDENHHKPQSVTLEDIHMRIMKFVCNNENVAMWLQDLKRNKPRYYRDNLQVLLHILPVYDRTILIKAIRICLDKNIYNSLSVQEIANSLQKNREEQEKDLTLHASKLSETAECRPQKSDITNYDKIFKE